MTLQLVTILTQKPFHQKLWLSRKEAKMDVLLFHSNKGILCNSATVVASRVVTPEGAQQSKVWTNPNGHHNCGKEGLLAEQCPLNQEYRKKSLNALAREE
jgi:hypothetical protein